MILGVGSHFPFYALTQSDLDIVGNMYSDLYPANNVLNNRTVYDRPSSRLVGIAGELAFSRYLGAQGEYVGYESKFADFVTKGKFGDVKTKCRNSPPDPQFEGSIFAYGDTPFFAADYFVFMSTTEDISMVWFCGWMWKKDLLTHPQNFENGPSKAES